MDVIEKLDALIDEMTLDMIPEGVYRDLAEKIGVRNFIMLAETIGGTTFYLPKAETFTRPIRDQIIKEEFNGYNFTDLAIKYNLSERRIRSICGVGHTEGQCTIFEMLESDEKSTA